MFSFNFNLSYQFLEVRFFVILAVAGFFSFFAFSGVTQKIQNYIFGIQKNSFAHLGFILIAIVLFFISLGNILTSDYNPFIYFRF
jgi:hypothetical protein